MIASNQKGATAVEFAIILPMILLPLLFGIIEFSVFHYNNALLTYASRAAARKGLVYAFVRDDSGTPGDKTDDKIYTHPPDSEIEKEVLLWKDRFITFGTNPSPFGNIIIKRVDQDDPSIEPAFGNERRGDYLVVTLEYSYDFLFLFPILGTKTLKAETVMRLE